METLWKLHGNSLEMDITENQSVEHRFGRFVEVLWKLFENSLKFYQVLFAQSFIYYTFVYSKTRKLIVGIV